MSGRCPDTEPDIGCSEKAAHERAIERVLEWIEDEVAVIRYGKDGIYRVRPPSGLVAARFRHYEARSGMPLLHDHLLEMFDRLARTMGHACRPHMLRHSAATRWLRDGVDRDVVQRLLGHASPLSMERYRHVDDAEARAAVEHIASLKERP